MPNQVSNSYATDELMTLFRQMHEGWLPDVGKVYTVTMTERQRTDLLSCLGGPLGTQNAAPQPSTAACLAAPSKEGVGRGAAADAAPSVGPWKECVYKHQDGPVDKARAYDWLTKMWPLEITRLAQASTPWEKPTSSEVHRAIKMAMESSPPATALPVKEG